MNRTRSLFAVSALVCLLPLAACGKSPSSADTAKSTGSAIGAEIQQAMDKAKQELATENLSIGSVHFNGRNGRDRTSKLPKAQITPQGELLIEGEKIDATPEQQALLKGYRAQLLDVAQAGMDIGAQGAELGVKAASEALAGLFSGDADGIEKRIEAQADKIKASAATLCSRLPALLESQHRLAAAMPEFKPYATMEQSDIDDCGKDID